MHTLGSSVMVTLMDPLILVQGLLLDLMEEQQAVVTVDSMTVVEIEVIRMMPTKMMPLLMQALIIMPDGLIMPMPLDGAPSGLLFPVQLDRRLVSPVSEKTNNISNLSINDHYCVTTTTSGQEEERVDNDFTPVILVVINTIQRAETREALVTLLDTGSMQSFIHHRSCVCPRRQLQH
eukprot:scaffold91610_cov58-Attheya_sp.AAC.5